MAARAAFLSLASWRDARRQRAILRPTPPPPQRPALRRRAVETAHPEIGRSIRLRRGDHRHAVRVCLSRGDVRRHRGRGRTHRRLADPHA